MRAPRALRRRGNQDGAMAIVLSLFVSVVCFGLGALVVDMGLARDTKAASQVASDASALAAANVLYPTSRLCRTPSGTRPPCFGDAVAAAKEYAAANFGVAPGASEDPWQGCTDTEALKVQPDTGDQCISFDDWEKPTRVRVVMPERSLAAGFGATYGASEYTIGTAAGAALPYDVKQDCALCFLGPVDAGNADFTVNGGSIVVNGDLDVGPNSGWTATDGGSIGIVGTVVGGQFSPSWRPSPPIPDPFAGLTMPTTAGLANRDDPCSDGPGVYGSFEIPDKGTCHLDPGLYVITGTWSEKNNSVLAGDGVTLYFTATGALDGKNGEIDLTAGAPGYEKFAIIYDRDNTSALTLQGNGGTSITGAVYLAGGSLQFNGNSCFGFDKGPVVAGGVIQGNGNKACVTIADSSSASLPPAPGLPSLDR